MQNFEEKPSFQILAQASFGKKSGSAAFPVATLPDWPLRVRSGAARRVKAAAANSPDLSWINPTHKDAKKRRTFAWQSVGRLTANTPFLC